MNDRNTEDKELRSRRSKRAKAKPSALASFVERMTQEWGGKHDSLLESAWDDRRAVAQRLERYAATLRYADPKVPRREMYLGVEMLGSQVQVVEEFRRLWGMPSMESTLGRILDAATTEPAVAAKASGQAA